MSVTLIILEHQSTLSGLGQNSICSR